MATQAIGTDTLADIPAVKVRLFADQAKSLDAARLQALESHKRATLTIALLVVQAARALDDLGEMFVRRMQHIHNAVALDAVALDRYRATTVSRDTRRWERFDCGHHVRRSPEGDSRSVDLRVQQAIQSALGLGPGQSTEANAWIVHTALAQRVQLAQVQVARETLHELRTEQRDERRMWRKTA